MATLTSLELYTFATAVDLALHIFIRLIWTRQLVHFTNAAFRKLLHIAWTVKYLTEQKAQGTLPC